MLKMNTLDLPWIRSNAQKTGEWWGVRSPPLNTGMMPLTCSHCHWWWNITWWNYHTALGSPEAQGRNHSLGGSWSFSCATTISPQFVTRSMQSWSWGRLGFTESQMGNAHHTLYHYKGSPEACSDYINHIAQISRTRQRPRKVNSHSQENVKVLHVRFRIVLEKLAFVNLMCNHSWIGWESSNL